MDEELLGNAERVERRAHTGFTQASRDGAADARLDEVVLDDDDPARGAGEVDEFVGHRVGPARVDDLDATALIGEQILAYGSDLELDEGIGAFGAWVRPPRRLDSSISVSERAS